MGGRAPWWIGLALAGAVAVLSGCGGGDGFAADNFTSFVPGSNPITRAAGGPVTLIEFSDQWSSARPRTVDVGDVAYLADFLGAGGKFPAGSPRVTVTWSVPGGAYVAFHIEAAGLKPNFLYQLKLCGKPGGNGTGLWGTDAGMWANERILRAGRWWNYRTEDPAFTTTNDTLVLRSADYKAGWVPGYVYFGSFITDGSGAYSGDVAGNRSYHVTWKEGQTGSWIESHPQSPLGPDRANTTAYGTSPYDPTPGHESGGIDVWYEAEPDDPYQLMLPNGTYDVVLMVTEESFHGAFTGGGGDTGYWDTVLVSDWPTGASPKTGLPWVAQRGGAITFAIGSTPTGDMATTVAAVWRYNGKKYQPKATVTVTAGGQPVAGATVAGTFTGAHTGTVSGTTDATGTVIFYGPPKWTNANGTFTFTLDAVTATGLTWTPSGVQGESWDIASGGEVG